MEEKTSRTRRNKSFASVSEWEEAWVSQCKKYIFKKFLVQVADFRRQDERNVKFSQHFR
jgi:hypothetical protein